VPLSALRARLARRASLSPDVAAAAGDGVAADPPAPLDGGDAREDRATDRATHRAHAAAPRDAVRDTAGARGGGLRLMALGAFWFSIMSLAVKLGGRRLPSQELVLVRAVVTLALSWIALRRAGLTVAGPATGRLLLRGALGCLGLTCFYHSLVTLPLGEATLIQYTNPVFAAVLAALVLHERVGAREIASLAASLVGVALVVRPATLAHALGLGAGAAGAALPPAPVAIAVLGALASAGAYVTVRHIGPAVDPRRVMLFLPLVTVPATLPFALDGWLWPTPQEWAILLVMSGATQIAQGYMTRGLQRERTARATAVGYLQVAFAAAGGALLFGERPSAWALVGGAVIVASTLALALRRRAPAGPA
jgi:drug/metabolite transporter (DMT)-like permease